MPTYVVMGMQARAEAAKEDLRKVEADLETARREQTSTQEKLSHAQAQLAAQQRRMEQASKSHAVEIQVCCCLEAAQLRRCSRVSRP